MNRATHDAPRTNSPPYKRRRFPRYACQHAIVVIDHAGRNATLIGECRTLSRGGFGAVIAGDLPVGRMVSIRFKPRFMEKTISLEARVLYRDNGFHGFEFIAPGKEQREAVAALFREAVEDSAELDDRT